MVVISSVVGWLQLSDLGIGAALQNPLTEARAQGDPQRQSELSNTALFALVAIGGVLTVIGLFVFPWVNWLKVFPPVTTRFVSEIPVTVLIVFFGFVSSLILSSVGAIYAARQELHLNSLPALIAGISGLIGTLVAVRLNAGLIGVVFATIGVTALVKWSFAIWTLYGRGIPELRPSISACSRGALRALFGRGMSFFLLQICSIAFFSADAFIIAHFLSTDQVTPYSVAQKVFLQMGGLFALVSGTLWSAYGNAKATGDIAWIRRTQHRMARVLLLFFGVLSLMMVVAGHRLLQWWVGNAAAPGTILIFAVACYFCAREWTTLHAMLLNGLDVIRPQVWVLAITACLTLGFSILLVRSFGVVGLAIGGFIGFCALSVWYLPYLAEQSLRRMESTHSTSLIDET
jgi:O-antigen/teichoic acid export membrane protein